MSVFAYPRIYFKGFVTWDPCTSNNNDFIQTYDGGNVKLNWGLIAQGKEGVRRPTGVTDVEGRKGVRSWFHKYPSPVSSPQQSGPPKEDFVPAEWNYMGGNGASFTQYAAADSSQSKVTTVCGGALAPDRAAGGDDPLLSQPVLLEGNTFTGTGGSKDFPTGSSPGRLIDTNPASFWTSQIFFKTFALGREGCGIVAERQNRMYSRWVYFQRNQSQIIAGVASVTWQTATDWSGIRIENTGGSELLAALQKVQQDKTVRIDGRDVRVRGLMLRFNSYLTRYRQNGTFNDGQPPYPPMTEADQKDGYFYDRLAKTYEEAFQYEFQPGRTVPSVHVPAYSRVVGVAGLWLDDDGLRSIGQGRFLAPGPGNANLWPAGAAPPHERKASKVADFVAYRLRRGEAPPTEALSCRELPPEFKPMSLGTTLASLSDEGASGKWLHLDLQNTFPECNTAGEKIDWGAVQIGTIDASGDLGTFRGVLTLDYDRYDLEAYEATGGLVDVQLDDDAFVALKSGPLALVVDAEDLKNGGTVKALAMVEHPLAANTDERGLYANQADGKVHTARVQVTRGDAPAPRGTKLLVVKYDEGLGIIGSATGVQFVTLCDSAGGNIEQAVAYQDAQGRQDSTWGAVLEVAGEDGFLDVSFTTTDPGFPNLGLFPFEGATVPAPDASLNTMVQGYASVRIWPDDSKVQQAFVDEWNRNVPLGHDLLRKNTWTWMWENVLYVYDFVYPIMLTVMPLGDLQRIEKAVDQLIAVLSNDWEEESTVFMPVTRDLSAGRKWVLQTWAKLISRNYPLELISVEPLA